MRERDQPSLFCLMLHKANVLDLSKQSLFQFSALQWQDVKTDKPITTLCSTKNTRISISDSKALPLTEFTRITLL